MRGVRNEDVELAESLHCRFDQIVTERRLNQIAFRKYAFSAVRFDGAPRLFGVGTLGRQMGDHHVGSLASEEHRDCASNTRIAARDQRDLAI